MAQPDEAAHELRASRLPDEMEAFGPVPLLLMASSAAFIRRSSSRVLRAVWLPDVPSTPIRAKLGFVWLSEARTPGRLGRAFAKSTGGGWWVAHSAPRASGRLRHSPRTPFCAQPVLRSGFCGPISADKRT
jgi:hypothetical protein